MFDLINSSNNFDLAKTDNTQVYVNFKRSLDSEIFDTFEISDMLKFAQDIINIYMSWIEDPRNLESEYSIPLFSQILEEAIYFYYKRLYDTTSDYYEDYSKNIFELEDNLYVTGAYHDLMDFVYTVLNTNNLTFGYSDYNDKNKRYTVIINDAQLDIFKGRWG